MAKKLEVISVVDDKTENKNVVNFELNAEIVAGKLTSNAKELKEKIENELKNYSVEKYINDPDAAKTDKALLNKIKDTVATKRKEISNAWNKPLDEFLSEMKSLEKSISDASDKINEIVKEADNKEKEEKKKLIKNYWATLDFNAVTLEKIFNPKWLNKTYKINQIMLDCEEIIEKISGELNTLKSMNDEDSELLMNFYLDTLDLNATLQKGNQLKANREALKKLNESKIEQSNIVSTPAEEKNVAETVNNAKLNTPVTTVQKDEMTYTLRVTSTRAKLFALKQYLIANKIDFEKVQ